MMKKWKNRIFFSGVLALFFAMHSQPAMAYDFKVNGICYNWTSATTVEATYEYYSDNSTYVSGVLSIPRLVSYGGSTYLVTGIGNDAFRGCRSLRSVSIPNSVTTIGSSAFYLCQGLASVEIPNSVTTIGHYAFDNCI